MYLVSIFFLISFFLVELCLIHFLLPSIHKKTLSFFVCVIYLIFLFLISSLIIYLFFNGQISEYNDDLNLPRIV